jgi:hypothetical protein
MKSKVRLQVADFPLVSVAVAVIVAEPSAVVSAVDTRPVGLTFAIFVSLLVQVSCLFKALLGLIVALSCKVLGTSIVAVAGVRLMLDTSTLFTVTEQVSVLAPTTVVAVTVVGPAATDVTRPLGLIVTIPEGLLLHVTLLFEASTGSTVAVS